MNQPDSAPAEAFVPSAPPEWWQASATILALLALLGIAVNVLPATGGWDPFESIRPFLTKEIVDYFWLWLHVVAGVLFLSYPLAAMQDPGYNQAPFWLKARPWLVLFGVFCPLITCATATGLGIQLLNDRQFTYYTLVLSSAWLVPLFNWLCIYKVLFSMQRPDASLCLMNGVGLVLPGSLALISLIFNLGEPVVVFACMALCTLSTGALSAMFEATHKPSAKSQLAGIVGLLAALTLYCLPQLSYEFHRTMVICATSGEDADARRAAIRMLRAFGSRDELVRGAYDAHHMRSMSGASANLTEHFRSVHYWVTGEPFNKNAPPMDVQLVLALGGDRDLAGTVVGERANGVVLAESKVEGEIETANAVGHLVWTMSFRNTTEQPQEARAQLQLPDGAVVSGAFLWVNGEPRPAVVSRTETARRAYQNVVLGQKRDPLLVTWKPGDRVMIQCFPVPGKSTGKDIKIQLDITTPLQTDALDKVSLNLPWITERNFDPSGLTRAAIHELGRSPDATQRTSYSEGAQLSWARKQSKPSKIDAHYFQKQMVSSKHPAPKQLYVVIDGSSRLAPYRDRIVTALKQIPSSVPTKITFASDEVSQLCKGEGTGNSNLKEALQGLSCAPFVGGPDNSALLEAGIKASRGTQYSAIVWIHGAQPLLPPGGIGWTYNDSYSYGPYQYYDVQIGAGSNEFAGTVEDAKHLHLTEATVAKDLPALIATICGVREECSMNRKVIATPAADDIVGRQITPWLDHLASKRYAEEQIDWGASDSAVDNAIAVGLVVKGTAAVVLETDEDYVDNGLVEPDYTVDQASVRGGSGPIEVFGSFGGAGSGRGAGVGAGAADGYSSMPIGAPVPIAPRSTVIVDERPALKRKESRVRPSAGRVLAAAPSASLDSFAVESQESASAPLPPPAEFMANRKQKDAPSKSIDDGNLPTLLESVNNESPSRNELTPSSPRTAAQQSVQAVLALLLLTGAACIGLIFLAIERGWHRRRYAATVAGVLVVALMVVGTKITSVLGLVGSFGSH